MECRQLVSRHDDTTVNTGLIILTTMTITDVLLCTEGIGDG